MKVLVALDGSSDRAAAAVSTWAQSGDVELRLLSVLNAEDVHETAAPLGFTHAMTPAGSPSSYGLNLQEPVARLAEDRSQALARVTSERLDYLENIRATRLPGVAATCEVQHGDDPATVIRSAAVEFGADFIVMGTHGRSGLGRAVLGSVAERVVREATVPVLVVGPHVPAVGPWLSKALAR